MSTEWNDTDNARAETTTATIEDALGFHIEERAGVPVLVWSQGGCSPATTAERAMWNLLLATARTRPAETTTATDEDADVEAVAHHLWSHYSGSLCGLDGCRYQDGEADADYECECPECWTSALATARGLADAGLLATARTRPTRQQVIDVLREKDPDNHDGWHSPADHYYEAQADAVLALLDEEAGR